MTFQWYGRIAKYRVDIPPGSNPASGKSRYWFCNVVRAANYSAEGQAPLRHFWFWAVIWQLALFVDLVIVLAVYIT
jgi:hypothetical protein